MVVLMVNCNNYHTNNSTKRRIALKGRRVFIDQESSASSGCKKNRTGDSFARGCNTHLFCVYKMHRIIANDLSDKTVCPQKKFQYVISLIVIIAQASSAISYYENKSLGMRPLGSTRQTSFGVHLGDRKEQKELCLFKLLFLRYYESNF